MKIFKELKKLGYKHYTEHTIEELDNLPLNSEERIMEQALVLRWFRDKYKVSGEITSSFYSEGEENEWEFNIYQLDKGDEEYNTLPIFKSYEAAELECLKKLIEIVKNK